MYRRLFKYRERPDRTPHEDFLTEAIADLFNRLPENISKELVAFLIKNCPNAFSNLKSYWPSNARTHWHTQKYIEGGIIDLLFEIDGVPFLVIENKISAGFQEHQSYAESSELPTKSNQLATYGTWLNRQADPSWGGALILLTHWTEAPADLLQSNSTYGCPYRSTVRWADLFGWLDKLTSHAQEEGTDWVRLSRELTEFLKEENMNSDLATGSDLAVLRIYVASADRVRNTVERIWESAKSIWRPLCQQTSIPLEISTAYGCVWKYRYLSRFDLRSSYLAIGIRYPDLSNYPKELALDESPYLFVELASEAEVSAIETFNMPTGWTRVNGMQLAVISLQCLPVNADLFVSEAEVWVKQRMSEIADALIQQ